MASFLNRYTMDNAKKIPLALSPFLKFDSRLLKGWGPNFIIAGEFIHDVLGNFKPRNIDFYIFTKAGFNEVLNLYSSAPGRKYTIKTHYIEISGSDNDDYVVRLINAFDLTPIEIMNAMEIELLCCYYDGENIYQFPGCADAIDSWNVVRTTDASKCCASTIIRAIEQGYNISREILKELGVDYPDADQPNILSCAGLSPGERDDLMDYYHDELYEYMQVAVKPSNEDLHDLYVSESDANFQMQGITVYHMGLAKAFLPYIYQNPIKERIACGTNINCGCFEMIIDMEEIVEVLHTEKKALERPPAPSRPPPAPVSSSEDSSPVPTF